MVLIFFVFFFIVFLHYLVFFNVFSAFLWTRHELGREKHLLWQGFPKSDLKLDKFDKFDELGQVVAFGQTTYLVGSPLRISNSEASELLQMSLIGMSNPLNDLNENKHE